MTKQQLEDFAKVELLIRHVRNLYELGPHGIRAEAVYAHEAFEKAMGVDYSKVFKTKTWKGKSGSAVESI